MRTIELTKQQLDVVINSLADAHDTNDNFSVEIEVDDELTVIAEGFVEIYGYVEDDYYRGTGGYVEAYRNAGVTLTGWTIDRLTEDDEEVEIGAESVKKVEEYLNAA